ncbi:hypothetical protein RclHR1_16980001, partial [Rhizophagus clarus]
MSTNKDFVNQAEMDDALLKQFLVANTDVRLMVKTPRHLQPKSYLLASFIATCIGRFVKMSGYHDWEICTANLETQPPVQQQQSSSDIAISQPIQHQSDSMNLNDSQGNTNIKVPSTPHHPNPITPPATPLSRAQKKSAKKKLKKLQKQQQQQEENPFIVPSRPSPEQTPSGSKVVTFNNVPPHQVTSSKISDNIKPSEQSTINPEKKRKQEHLAENFNNSNLILTGYCPQQEEQAQLLDLIVYDIPAKWDSYTLLGNLSFWGKIVSISTRC